MLNLKKIKPVNIIASEKLPDLERCAVKSGVNEMIKLLLGYAPKYEIQINYAQAQNERWVNEIGKYYSQNNNQLNGAVMMKYLFELSKKENHPYLIYVTRDDIYYEPTSGTRNLFSVGLSQEGSPSIISTNRFQGIVDEKLRASCIKTATMHEVGHMFG